MTKEMKVSRKRLIYCFAGIGVMCLVLPLLLSFIEFSETPRVSISDGMIFLCTTPVILCGLWGDRRKERILPFLGSIIPLAVCWLGGFSFMVALRGYSVNWSVELLKLGTMILGGIIIGLFVLWLMPWPTTEN